MEKPKDEDIFVDDVDKLVEEVYPDHEGQHPLLKKFGTRTGGFCDIWLRTKDWKLLPEIEKWKYVAWCSLYWEKQYAYWYWELEQKDTYERLKKTTNITLETNSENKEKD